MAGTGGPIFPFSAIPVTAGDVFPYVLDTANFAHIEGPGLGADADVAGDAIWRLRFAMPLLLPSSGTLKLRLHAYADATSGVARFNPKWGATAAEEDQAALTAEGATDVTWALGDDKQHKENKIVLDASAAPVAGDVVQVDLTFEGGHANFTLATKSLWIPSLIWET